MILSAVINGLFAEDTAIMADVKPLAISWLRSIEDYMQYSVISTGIFGILKAVYSVFNPVPTPQYRPNHLQAANMQSP